MRAHTGLATAAPQLVTTVMRDAVGPAHVTVTGELDIATAASFRTALADVIRTGGADIVLDASGLTFCDACGLGAIVAAGDQAEGRGGGVSLTGVRPRLARILHVTGLYKRFVAAGMRAALL